MNLHNEPYELIKNETKTIELRLNDEKRQNLKEKDLIEFTNRTTNETMLVEIEKLYHYNSFAELYKKDNEEVIIAVDGGYKVLCENNIKFFYSCHRFFLFLFVDK